MVADDKSIEKKDKTVGEPCSFTFAGARAPYEIVVFEVSKDHAKGYLSTPKLPTLLLPRNQRLGTSSATATPRMFETIAAEVALVNRIRKWVPGLRHFRVANSRSFFLLSQVLRFSRKPRHFRIVCPPTLCSSRTGAG